MGVAGLAFDSYAELTDLRFERTAFSSLAPFRTQNGQTGRTTAPTGLVILSFSEI